MSAVHASTLARLPLHVTAGCTQLNLGVQGNFQAFGGDHSLGVYIDGAYSGIVTPAADGYSVLPIALDGAAHDIDIVNSYQIYFTGAFAYSFSGVGGVVTKRAVTTPAAKWCLYGDSMTAGAFATVCPRDSFAARLQNLLPFGAVSLEASGGHRLYDDTGTLPGQLGVGSLQLLANRFVYHLRGAPTKNLGILIGFNDWNTSAWNAAAYGAGLGSELDLIHAADPSIRVFLFSPLITGMEAATNLFVETIGATRAQCAAVAATRTGFVTFTPGTSLMTIVGVGGDNIHPNDNGHLAIYDGSGPAAGLTSMRAVFGV